MPATSSKRIQLTACPLCGGSEFMPVLTVETHPVVRCVACELHFANPQANNAELAAIYGPDYGLAQEGTPLHANIVLSKRETADHYLDLLARNGVSANGRLVEIGCGAGNFLLRAADRGYDVTGVEYSPFACARARTTLGGRGRVLQGEIDVLSEESAAYDVCILCDVIEHVRNPTDFLNHASRLLRPGGIIMVITPTLDSWSAWVMRSRWMEWKAEHLFYFSRRTITRQLARCGFDRVQLFPGTKRLSLDYVVAHFDKYPVPGLAQGLRVLRTITPRALREHMFSIVASGLVALARKPLDSISASHTSARANSSAA